MTATEVILLVIGFLSICGSFFLGNREKTGEEELPEDENVSRNVWTEKEEELVRERIQSILEEEKENILAETTDTLNRKSNEKIMEFDEFSGQLLEKINHNHEEVVFMYHMLTKKEEEWKEAAAKPDTFVKKPLAAPEPEEETPGQTPVKKAAYVGQPGREGAAQMTSDETGKTQPAEKEAGQAGGPVHSQEEERVHPPVTGLERLAKSHPAKTKTAVRGPQQKAAQQPSGQGQAASTVPAEAAAGKNVNDQVLKLYKQGKSVVEISKELNVGQGEVKLTIALYGGNR